MKSRKSVEVMTCIALTLSAQGASGATWFVRATAPAMGADGLSWGTAYRRVQDALAVAAPGDVVLVAQGTYKPGTARTSSFNVTQVTLRGGFPASGGPPDSNSPILYPTILSGDVGSPGVASDNSYHVVVMNDATLDGFIVEGGNADSTAVPQNALGGGVYVNSTGTILNCTIRDNQALSGGGVYYFTNSDLMLTVFNCTILSNDAIGIAAAGYGYGGGLYTYSQEGLGTVVVNRCSFLGNTAGATGGGVHTSMGSRFQNTAVCSNSSVSLGGGMYLPTMSLGVWTRSQIQNCTVAGNHSGYVLGAGGASLIRADVSNSIFYSNTAAGGSTLDQQVIENLSTIQYSDTEGGAWPSGSGNISADPHFESLLGTDATAGTDDDNPRLTASSPCIEVGGNALAATPLDRDGRPRIRNFGALPAIVDLGAYEFFLPPMITKTGPATLVE
jgi:hypothetical protein